MEPGAEIRKAGPDDAAAVAAIVQDAYAKYVPRIGRPPRPMLEDYAALIRDGIVWVLTEGAQAVGVLVLEDRPDHLLLQNVALAPHAQGRGLGKRLLDYAEQEALARGYGEIRLYTNEKMTENIAIYTKIGYRETHRDTADYRRLFMSKRLAKSAT
ncbi:MAG TPA: GNAT family N-acetyltransferase [Alphaproteobacteria bacterium]|jgi:GNAT superfamily N-acetyltransferase